MRGTGVHRHRAHVRGTALRIPGNERGAGRITGLRSTALDRPFRASRLPPPTQGVALGWLALPLRGAERSESRPKSVPNEGCPERCVSRTMFALNNGGHRSIGHACCPDLPRPFSKFLAIRCRDYRQRNVPSGARSARQHRAPSTWMQRNDIHPRRAHMRGTAARTEGGTPSGERGARAGGRRGCRRGATECTKAA